VRPELRHLAYFVAVAEELNFTRAAARLNVVQQALSAGVAQLETLVGARPELFEAARVGRACGMVPESVARSRAWPGLAFVRVADVEPSIAAVACRPGESRQAVRNFLALAGPA
jgi:DNA-binding transcriptional LysR family regulator